MLVEMNVSIHLQGKVDCPEILCVRFSNSKKSILLPDFYISFQIFDI